ncbi:MAG: phospholipid/cholesterol/gamma-HCH transport system permease protein [Tenuifilum sp.]|jgi:phospholipid/cholesterol/gamma-HCH transport system permease protein|uniref:ABC transporter permease n=1 Tax=Tenuifilum thalassicum TaxID=2590900 RepID=A0A7D4BCM6_9BACT|nr:phospholipid/cholesterol/gamma-HCH transport system permease protein [Tenuifilum sp.]QKG78883.1 ABC transporter permease [Tenuifilum thalassicum]
MNILKGVEIFGEYVLLLKRVFSKPEKKRVYYRQTIKEIDKLGLQSIWIVTIISAFMGAVITLQTAYNMENPFIPTYLIGLGTRDSMLLEFSSTVIGLILAGKVGSNIASEIGTMRVSEQIDALEIMGVNSASFLILPKIIATVLFNPFLSVLSMIVGITGGWLVGVFTGVVSSQEYINGVQYAFIPFYITYSLIKTVVFAFLITTISAFYGYRVQGGSLEVGKASTQAVVMSSIFILLFNLLLTQLLLS